MHLYNLQHSILLFTQDVWSNRTLCYPKQFGFGRVSEADGDLLSLGYGENGVLNWFSLDCEQFFSPISVKASDPGGLINIFSRKSNLF